MRDCAAFPFAGTLVVRAIPVDVPGRLGPGAGRVVAGFADAGFDAPGVARAVAYTEVAVFARATGTGVFVTAPLEGTPAPTRGRALVSSLAEGALAGRAI